MLRCRQTADHVFPDREKIVVDDLRECDFGIFEYKNYIELENNKPYRDWVDGGCHGQIPEGDHVEQFKKRCVDAFLDIYYQLCRLNSDATGTPDENLVAQWMDRWPSGLDPAVSEIMFRNKQRIMHHLVERVSSKSNRSVHYRFEEGLSYEDKYKRIGQWWNDYRFHIAMAARTPKEIYHLLGGTLRKENYAIGDIVLFQRDNGDYVLPRVCRIH